MKKQIIFLLALFSILWIGTVAQAAIIVGRIGHVEGDIYRYMDVGNEWVETFVDSPAGTGDILATGAGIWNGFGFTLDAELPGPAAIGCADVDGNGTTEPVILR